MAPKDDANHIQMFKCKNCGIDVSYKRKAVLGLAGRGKDSDNDNKEKVVYLTCDNGHTFPYTVMGA